MSREEVRMIRVQCDHHEGIFDPLGVAGGGREEGRMEGWMEGKTETEKEGKRLARERYIHECIYICISYQDNEKPIQLTQSPNMH